jgi:hypothetical protein
MKRVIGILFCGLVACGGEATSDDPVLVVNNGGNNNQPTVRCADVCPTKAALCQVPSEYVDSVCSMFCAGGDDAERVSCIQSKGCDELVKAFEREPDSVCDASPPPPRDMGNNPPDMGNNTDMSSIQCEPWERRCDDGSYTAVRCDNTGGATVRRIEYCRKPVPGDAGTICDHGWCIDPERQSPLGSTCSTKADCYTPGDCRDGRCCQVVDEVCSKDSDCCDGTSCETNEFGSKVCKPR